jgi:hypothetical protein
MQALRASPLRTSLGLQFAVGEPGRLCQIKF